jgi:hypothetical protein
VTLARSRTVTRILENAKIPTKLPRKTVDIIDVRYVGQLSGHGSGLYIRVPAEIIDYFGLVAGDKVKVSIHQRKRWTEIEEK